MIKPLVYVAVTGGAGQIAYQLLFRIASGEMFGHEQPLSLQILEVPEALAALEGVKMELQDCAFPLLHHLVITSDPLQGFKDADYVLLIGAKPRSAGMERGELLNENAKIFVNQGQALNEVAKATVKVFVVGNPCNTNCLIAMSHAPRLSRKNFFSMTRLDQNRATFLLSEKAKLKVTDVSHVIVWGNHSSTQVPDFVHARLKGEPVYTFIKDRKWLENDFVELIRKRGAAIIQARGKSSAASAAQALLDAVCDTLSPTQTGDWFSSSVDSTGNPYGIADELIFSFPCHVLEKGKVSIVSGLKIDEYIDVQLKATERELLEERDLVKSLIKKD